MRVRYRDGEGREHRIDLVGPWDVEREDQVSYRSPLGAGMLGLHPGDRRAVDLPNGRVEVEILGVEHLPL